MNTVYYMRSEWAGIVSKDIPRLFLQAFWLEELGGVTRRALDMSSRDGDVVMFVTVTIWSDGAGVLFCALLIHHAAAS